MLMPRLAARLWLASDEATQRILSPALTRAPRAWMNMVEVVPVPRPTSMPSSTRAAARWATSCLASSCVMGFVLSVVQSVHHSAFAIERVSNDIVIGGVVEFVVAKERIGDEIRQLDEARCFRIDKYWNFSEVSQSAKGVTCALEVPSHGLNSSLDGTLIK